MRRFYKRLKRFIVYCLARALVMPLWLLPLGWVVQMGRWFGGIAYAADARGRQRAISQIERALRVDRTEAEGIAREAYRRIGRIAAEIALSGRIRPRVKEYVELSPENQARLEGAITGEGATVFVSAHVGNWELMAQRIGATGITATTLARESPNPFIGRWIVQKRAAASVKTINRGDAGAARTMLKALRAPGLLGVLIDQDTRVRSVHVPFFGVPAATPVAAAELGLKSGTPMILVLTRLRADGRGYALHVDTVDPAAHAHDDRAFAIQSLTAALTAKIEAFIRADPASWVWFHDRWRTKVEATIDANLTPSGSHDGVRS